MRKKLERKQCSNGSIYTFYLTPKCNLNCLYCYEPRIHLPPDMTTGGIEFYLKNILLKEVEPFAFFLFGGEPTLRWDLISFFQKIVASKSALVDVRNILFTNGLYLTKKRLFEMKSWEMELFLSFDGFAERSKLRYGFAIKKYLETIENIILMAIKIGIITTVVFTTGRHNIKYILEDMIRLYKYYGVKRFKINTIRRNDLSAEIEELIFIREKATNWAYTNQIEIAWDHPNKYGSEFENYFISSRSIRYLPANKKALWEDTKW